MKHRHQIMAFFAAALLVMACVSSADAQGRRGGGPGGMGGPGGPGMGAGMFGNNPEMMLLRRTDVRQELGLLDDQIKQLESAAEGVDFREMMSQFGDLPAEERMTKMRAAMEDMQKKVQQKVDEILLPHQASRLKELAVQMQMQGRGVTSEGVAEQLGITEEQREQLLEKSRKLTQEMQKKLHEELLKELTPAQQAKLKELAGEPFQFDPEEPFFGGRVPGAGAPGAPGGRRPGAAGGQGGRRGGGGRGN